MNGTERQLKYHTVFVDPLRALQNGANSFKFWKVKCLEPLN